MLVYYLHLYLDYRASIQSTSSRPRERLLYAFRGWIAFVAFMDLGTAFRSYIERRSFLGDHSDTQFIEGKNI